MNTTRSHGHTGNICVSEAETGTKQELVSCLINESKRKTGGNELEGSDIGTGKNKKSLLEERSTLFKDYYSSEIEDKFRHIEKKDGSEKEFTCEKPTEVVCYFCKGREHFANKCPSKRHIGDRVKEDEKSGEAKYIIEWLELGVPLYSRNLIGLMNQQDPKIQSFSKQEQDWLKQELVRLQKTKAI
ncbi:10912_t:CDS:2, partial [Cetraspora pellucida]